MDIKKIKEDRFKFLKLIYEITEGHTGFVLNMFEVGQKLGFDRQNSGKIGQYLIDENLLTPAGMGGFISLSHYGVLEIEESLSNPDKPTEHFLPFNVINIGNMYNSAIQQGSHNSNQTFTVNNSNISELQSFINDLKNEIKNLGLTDEVQNELTSEVATLTAQTTSPKPKPLILVETLKSIRTILEGAAGSVIASGFIEKIPILIQLFSGNPSSTFIILRYEQRILQSRTSKISCA